MRRLGLLIFFGAVFIKGVVWQQLVPILQTPDEQAHFAQLQWYAEKKNLKIEPRNLSLELAMVEEILGTRRDEAGNNKYTYHPEYKNRERIISLPMETRTVYVDREAAGYPPLYYLLALPFYNAVYFGNIAERLMASRLLSLVLGLGLAAVAYQTGRVIWKEKMMAIVLATFVSFQPMVSYVGAGFHPDNLLNLIYSAGILVCLLILKNGVRLGYLGYLGVLGVLGWETKQTMALFVPIAAAVIFYRLSPKLIGLSAAALISPALAFVFQWPLPYIPTATGGINLIEYLRFRLPKLFFEIWPWFWGVFKWLGVTLPPLVMKIITRVTIFAGIGLVIGGIRGIRDFETKAAVFSFLSLISYILYLVLWDWRLMQAQGFSQGLQGRYFLPLIIPAMILLLMGIQVWHKKLVPVLGIAAIVLNAIALRLIYVSY